ncbi:MAG: HAMP domain-containing protein [Anaerolineae bacterium]|nr:HAMP domain-containing protein [Anaerolineae bacterium]
MFNSLRIRLTLLFVALTVVPLVIVSSLIASRGFDTLQQQAVELQNKLARETAISLGAFFNERQNELFVLTNIYGIDYLPVREQRDILLTLQSVQTAYYELVMVDATGQETLRLTRGEAVTTTDLSSRADDPLFQSVMASGQTRFSPVYFNQNARDRLITVAIPIEDLFTGQTGNVLIAELRFQTVQEAVLRDLDLTENQDVYLVDTDGVVIAHRNPSFVLNETIFSLPDTEGRQTGLQGGDVILAMDTIQLENLELIVVAETAFTDATALASDLSGIAGMIALVTLLIAGTVVTVVVSRVVDPIVRISRVAQSIQSGDLSARVAVKGNDEIAQLGRTFNAMTGQIQAMIAEEQNKQNYLETTVSRYTQFVEAVSRGNLRTRLTLNGHESGTQDAEDELIRLGQYLNNMVSNLHDMAAHIREVAKSITTTAGEIQAAATVQLANSTEQDAAVTQTFATVEEFHTTVQQTADHARMVADVSRQSVDVSTKGQDSVRDTVEGMRIIRERMESIAANILQLSGHTQQIGEIVETVNVLADQSKMLALNASIEAARAGEEGRGFAVVAAEVRQLAAQSQEATTRVREILTEIQQATNTAVMVTEEGSKGTETGMELVEVAGEAIRDLAVTITDAANSATQIAASTQQQTSGMNQLKAAMVQIRQATNETAVSMAQTEQSVRDLMEMAHQMEQAVARYEL